MVEGTQTSNEESYTAPAVLMDADDFPSMLPPTFGTDLKAKRRWIKEHQAAAFRYLGQEGYGKEGVAGHISVADPIFEGFWLNPLAKHFSLITASDLVLVDLEGRRVKGQGGNENAPVNTAAFAIHSAIHKARPDVKAAVHAHSIAGKAFSTLGIELDITTQDACVFYQDHAVYTNFGGVVFEEAEGQAIAQALGTKRALILQNHGLLTTGRTVDEAVYLFGVFDRCCQVQLLADGAAKARDIATVKVGHEEAYMTWKTVGAPESNYLSFQPEYERLEKITNGDFKL